MAIPATLIPSDGIGPEIMVSIREIIAPLGSPFDWDEQQAGLGAIATNGDPLPKSTLDSIRATKLALKGPLTTPVAGGFKSVNVELRRELELFANLRPATIVCAAAVTKTSTSPSCANAPVPLAIRRSILPV